MSQLKKTIHLSCTTLKIHTIIALSNLLVAGFVVTACLAVFSLLAGKILLQSLPSIQVHLNEIIAK